MPRARGDAKRRADSSSGNTKNSRASLLVTPRHRCRRAFFFAALLRFHSTEVNAIAILPDEQIAPFTTDTRPAEVRLHIYHFDNILPSRYYDSMFATVITYCLHTIILSSSCEDFADG